MRVSVDLTRCQGYGNCVAEAPDVFDLDEASNQVVLLEEAPAPERAEAVRAAARSCPVIAIAVED